MEKNQQIERQQIKIEGLEEKHNDLKKDVDDVKGRVARGFQDLSGKLDEQRKENKPNTGLVLSAVGLALTAVVWFIRLTITPLGDKIDKSLERNSFIRAELMRIDSESTKDHETVKSWNEWLLEDIREIRDDVKKLGDDVSTIKNKKDL